jgi:glycerol-3-phosphate acyltransferase PlsX
MLKRDISRSITGILGYLLMKPALRNFKNKTDYAEHGGAPLLGINGTSIISHGRSSSRAIMNAIGVAAKLAGKKLHVNIAKEIAKQNGRERETVES